MDDLNRALLAWLETWLPITELWGGLRYAIGIGAACMAILVVFERRAGVSLEQYASRRFFTDVLYRLAFVVYIVMLYTPLSVATREAFPWMRVELLSSAPLWIGIPAYLLIFDFLSYWIHRAQHSRVWWRFHRVHHSQEQLTFATGYRNHPIDQAFAHTVTFIPLLLLGTPAVSWLPYSFLLAFIDATHHANLPWRFGWARKILVSPVFHATHHSTDPAVRDTNFGGLFSFWDFLFGTAVDAERRPERTGVEGWRVRERWLSHLVSPFRRDAVVEGAGANVRAATERE